jgi:hypothetical protein
MGGSDPISDDLTAARFQKSIRRKWLRKQGTITLGEKVKMKLENRASMAGRGVTTKRNSEAWARSALTTLNGLRGEKLTEIARRAKNLSRGNFDETQRVMLSQDPVDRALLFLHHVSSGFTPEFYALRRSPKLQEGWATWLKKAEKAPVGKLTNPGK